MDVERRDRFCLHTLGVQGYECGGIFILPVFPEVGCDNPYGNVFWWLTVKSGEAGFIPAPINERLKTVPSFGFFLFIDANELLW